MQMPSGRTTAYAVVVAIAVALTLFLFARPEREQVSKFGEYRGYSQAAYDGTRRSSDYLTMADGTRLAYELILPTSKGEVASERLPVLFKYTPYLRTWTIFDEDGKNLISDFIELGLIERTYLRLRYWLSSDGRYFDPLARTRWLEGLVKHGYAVIVVERPGTGASFGVLDPAFETNAREANEILDWIAGRPWSDGRIGMFGDSFQAMVQFAAAGTGNSHLKAIFPASSPLEMYDAIQYRGGVFNKAFAAFFAGAADHLETLVTPVDADKRGMLLAQALEERRNATLRERVDLSSQRYAFRDSLTPAGKMPWKGASLYPFIERINRAGVPVYMSTGWYDIFTGDMFYWYDSLTVPKRLTVRPLDHTGMDKTGKDLDYAAEAHRWFDYWLKGIDNGIMSEPPVHYYRVGAPKQQAWGATAQWPPAAGRRTPSYFATGDTRRATSVNDGALSPDAPADTKGFDAYTVDYTT
ncbi:MAG TPA: CocE/NonD family hydrolase, partial [Ramlibacter sp.]|nr:CocE/NonD family hydrolase [Ramlibacter sp.]